MRKTYLCASLVFLSAVSPSWADYAFKTLATFDGPNGTQPSGTIISDSNGNLYGVTSYGGDNFDGAIYEYSAASQSLSVLASLNNQDGSEPIGITADANGNLYGTTTGGGANNKGAIFEYSATSHTISVLASFNGSNGNIPQAPLVMDASGNLYGTALFGGIGPGVGNGTLFEYSATTHSITPSVLFNGPNGSQPNAGLIADKNGNLYGTTVFGGTSGEGNVFKFSPATQIITNLASFADPAIEIPEGVLIADAKGNLYGATVDGGTYGWGTIYKIDPVTQSLTILASCTSDDSNPRIGGIDAAGDIFATSGTGGAYGQGAVFEIPADTQSITDLVSFNGSGPDEVGPTALIVDPNGNLFGSTLAGGVDDEGTLFELSPVPEPTSLSVVAAGGLFTAFLRRKLPRSIRK